jgi:hypothetical protein
MVIRGRDVPPVHLLLERIDALAEAFARYPKGHPERKPIEAEHDRLAGELLFVRRKDWAAT